MSVKLMTWRYAGAALALAFSGSVSAQEAADCLGFELSATQPAALARVLASAPRVWFIKGATELAECPSTAAICRRKAYLVPGDQVLTTRSQAAWTCATFFDQRGRQTTGWLASDVLGKPETKAFSAQAWAGEWKRDAEADISIKVTGPNTIELSGTATWGAGDPDRVARGAVNIGELEATSLPTLKPLITFIPGQGVMPPAEADEFGCVVSAQRLGDFLLVEDNLRCGGMNVSFSGIYRR